jgi:hypothetical protein
MQRFRMEQHGETAHHVQSRLGDAQRVGEFGDRISMRRQRVQDLPCSHILCIAGEGRVDPAQRLGQVVPFFPRLRQPPPCYV